jgi:tol-pal system protein YbgF
MDKGSSFLYTRGVGKWGVSKWSVDNRYLLLIVMSFFMGLSTFGCELTTAGMNTDRSRNIRELERAVIDLERKVDEITLQLSKLNEKVNAYENEPSKSGLDASKGTLSEEPLSEEKITGDEADVPTVVGETVARDVGGDLKSEEPTTDNPQALYDSALKEILNRNVEKALPLFIDFVVRYPKDDLTDNAYYWIGECYYSLKKFGLALENFMIVQNKFPKSGKIPDSLLKIGFSYAELGDKARAKEVLSDLVSKYPDSSAADIARKRLIELK